MIGDFDPMLRALKTAGVAILGWIAAVWAQVELPSLDAVGNVGLVAALAVLIGRYTLRQLEDYRQDLRTARERIDSLEADLHELGQAKAQVERRLRDVEDYAHRLRIFVTSLDPGAQLPQPPAPPP